MLAELFTPECLNCYDNPAELLARQLPQLGQPNLQPEQRRRHHPRKNLVATSLQVEVEILMYKSLGLESDIRGGVQVDADNIYPYFGWAVGTPGIGIQITAGNGRPTPGINYNISGGFVVGASYGGALDITSPRTIFNSLKGGSLQFGGTTPGYSGTLIYVKKINFTGCN